VGDYDDRYPVRHEAEQDGATMTAPGKVIWHSITPQIHLAAAEGELIAVDFLMFASADISIRDRWGYAIPRSPHTRTCPGLTMQGS
jgi:hypothetical protein